MRPVSLDVAMLKLQLPELVLRPGMSVVARVASRGEGSIASLVLAGALLKASVPDEVRAGDTLRLTVAETSPERVVLRLEGTQAPQGDPGQAAAAAAQAGAPAELRPSDPDAGREGPDAPGRQRHGVSLAYETPALGRLDLRVQRGPEGVVVSVVASADAYDIARSGAERLREALETRLGVPAVVGVVPRRDPFDAYA